MSSVSPEPEVATAFVAAASVITPSPSGSLQRPRTANPKRTRQATQPLPAPLSERSIGAAAFAEDGYGAYDDDTPNSDSQQPQQNSHQHHHGSSSHFGVSSTGVLMSLGGATSQGSELASPAVPADSGPPPATQPHPPGQTPKGGGGYEVLWSSTRLTPCDAAAAAAADGATNSAAAAAAGSDAALLAVPDVATQQQSPVRPRQLEPDALVAPPHAGAQPHRSPSPVAGSPAQGSGGASLPVRPSTSNPRLLHLAHGHHASPLSAATPSADTSAAPLAPAASAQAPLFSTVSPVKDVLAHSGNDRSGSGQQRGGTLLGAGTPQVLWSESAVDLDPTLLVRPVTSNPYLARRQDGTSPIAPSHPSPPGVRASLSPALGDPIGPADGMDSAALAPTAAASPSPRFNSSSVAVTGDASPIAGVPQGENGAILWSDQPVEDWKMLARPHASNPAYEAGLRAQRERSPVAEGGDGGCDGAAPDASSTSPQSFGSSSRRRGTKSAMPFGAGDEQQLPRASNEHVSEILYSDASGTVDIANGGPGPAQLSAKRSPSPGTEEAAVIAVQRTRIAELEAKVAALETEIEALRHAAAGAKPNQHASATDDTFQQPPMPSLNIDSAAMPALISADGEHNHPAHQAPTVASGLPTPRSAMRRKGSSFKSVQFRPDAGVAAHDPDAEHSVAAGPPRAMIAGIGGDVLEMTMDDSSAGPVAVAVALGGGVDAKLSSSGCLPPAADGAIGVRPPTPPTPSLRHSQTRQPSPPAQDIPPPTAASFRQSRVGRAMAAAPVELEPHAVATAAVDATGYGNDADKSSPEMALGSVPLTSPSFRVFRVARPTPAPAEPAELPEMQHVVPTAAVPSFVPPVELPPETSSLPASPRNGSSIGRAGARSAEAAKHEQQEQQQKRLISPFSASFHAARKPAEVAALVEPVELVENPRSRVSAAIPAAPVEDLAHPSVPGHVAADVSAISTAASPLSARPPLSPRVSATPVAAPPVVAASAQASSTPIGSARNGSVVGAAASSGGSSARNTKIPANLAASRMTRTRAGEWTGLFLPSAPPHSMYAHMRHPPTFDTDADAALFGPPAADGEGMNGAVFTPVAARRLSPALLADSAGIPPRPVSAPARRAVAGLRQLHSAASLTPDGTANAAGAVSTGSPSSALVLGSYYTTVNGGRPMVPSSPHGPGHVGRTIARATSENACIIEDEFDMLAVAVARRGSSSGATPLPAAPPLPPSAGSPSAALRRRPQSAQQQRVMGIAPQVGGALSPPRHHHHQHGYGGYDYATTPLSSPPGGAVTSSLEDARSPALSLAAAQLQRLAAGTPPRTGGGASTEGRGVPKAAFLAEYRQHAADFGLPPGSTRAMEARVAAMRGGPTPDALSYDEFALLRLAMMSQ